MLRFAPSQIWLQSFKLVQIRVPIVLCLLFLKKNTHPRPIGKTLHCQNRWFGMTWTSCLCGSWNHFRAYVPVIPFRILSFVRNSGRTQSYWLITRREIQNAHTVSPTLPHTISFNWMRVLFSMGRQFYCVETVFFVVVVAVDEISGQQMLHSNWIESLLWLVHRTDKTKTRHVQIENEINSFRFGCTLWRDVCSISIRFLQA